MIDRNIPPPDRGGLSEILRVLKKKGKSGDSVLCPKRYPLRTVNSSAYIILGPGTYKCRTEKAGVRIWKLT